MRYFTLGFIFFFSINCLGQFPLEIYGKVTLNGKPLVDCHISNLSSQQHTSTSNVGMFTMNVNQGDILLISHLIAQEKYVIIEKQLADDPILNIVMIDKLNQLDEVFLKSEKPVTVQSVGIVQGKQYIPTANERRLLTAGDFKPIHLLGLLGGSLELDPIINAISGRTKRLKGYIELDKKIEVFKTLNVYHSEFISSKFEIDEDMAKQFFDSLIDHPMVDQILRDDNVDRIRIWLCQQFLLFKNN